MTSTAKGGAQLTITSITILASTFLLLCSGTSGLQLGQRPPPNSRRVNTSPPSPGIFASIDYSAANEYVASHYGSDTGKDGGGLLQPYFARGSRADEPVYDARFGVYDDRGRLSRDAMLDECGFSLHQFPNPMTTVDDWSDLDLVRRSYLPKLKRLILSALGGGLGSNGSEEVDGVSHLVFYHPMLRGEGLVIGDGGDGPKTSPPASVVHIDTDVGAHDVDGILDLIEGNRMAESDDESPFPRREIGDAIRDGRRFGVVNAWRNIDPDHPVEAFPLALLATRYRDGGGCFPSCRPDIDSSRWYSFSRMTSDECLLFKQYDRRSDLPSDIWHCAVSGERRKPDGHPRRSFDVRAFVVFHERVSKGKDRFGFDRVRPRLTLEESGCFCEQQEVERKERQLHVDPAFGS